MNTGLTLQNLFTELPDERVYQRVIRKDIKVKEIERVLKEMAVDCLFNKNLNYYGQYDQNKDYTRDCDYKKCEYKCHTEITNPEFALDLKEEDIDDSTYNLYFALPQINLAKNEIFRIFLKEVAISEQYLIQLIQAVNPGIEEDYIYSAMDQIIGNPPYINPLEIRDKYDRKGKIIYQNKYYIFQPDEIPDKYAPIYYKKTPKSVNYQGYSSKHVLDKVSDMKVKKVVLDYDKITVEQAISDILILSDELVTNDLVKITKIYDILDVLNITHQKEVFQTLIRDYCDETLFELLTTYYINMGLVFIKDDIVYHLFIPDKIAYLNTNQPSQEINDWIQKPIDDEVILIDENLKSIQLRKKGHIYGYRTFNSRGIQIKDSIDFNYDKIKDTIQKLNQYPIKSSVKFKLVQPPTTTDITDSRRINTGRNIDTIQKDIISGIVKTLQSHQQLPDKYRHESDLTVLLRVLEILDTTQKWYLNPFETELLRAKPKTKPKA